MLTSCCALAVQLREVACLNSSPLKSHHNSETSITFITNSAPSNTVIPWISHTQYNSPTSFLLSGCRRGRWPRGQASMNAQELLVEQSGQGKAVKGLHAGIIHALRVLNLACNERNTIKNTHVSPNRRKRSEWAFQAKAVTPSVWHITVMLCGWGQTGACQLSKAWGIDGGGGCRMPC